jgi:hypothetical protein
MDINTKSANSHTLWRSKVQPCPQKKPNFSCALPSSESRVYFDRLAPGVPAGNPYFSFKARPRWSCSLAGQTSAVLLLVPDDQNWVLGENTRRCFIVSCFSFAPFLCRSSLLYSSRPLLVRHYLPYSSSTNSSSTNSSSTKYTRGCLSQPCVAKTKGFSSAKGKRRRAASCRSIPPPITPITSP